jgi:hypothetical protein
MRQPNRFPYFFTAANCFDGNTGTAIKGFLGALAVKKARYAVNFKNVHTKGEHL